MPKVDAATPDPYETSSVELDKSALEYLRKEGGPGSVKEVEYSDGKSLESQQSKSQLSLNYGAHLIKTFKDDVNQIIHEESREESMSVSMMNSSKVREDYNSNSIETKSKYNSQSRRRMNLTFKSNKHTPEKPAEYEEKIFEIQDNDSFKVDRKKFEDSIESSM